MSNQLWEQREWKGIARKSPGRLDESTSLLEINTEPGEDELRRMHSRGPFLSGPMPAPAYHFTQQNHYLLLEASTGADPTMAYESGGAFTVSVCFKWDGIDIAPTANPDTIICGSYDSGVDLGAAHGLTVHHAWSIYLHWTGTVWAPYFAVNWGGGTYQQARIGSTGIIEKGKWYWIRLVVASTAWNAYIWRNGETSGGAPTLYDQSSASGLAARVAFTATGFACHLGGANFMSTYSFCKGSIAYFCCDDTNYPKPWSPVLASQETGYDASFLPSDPRKTCFYSYYGDRAGGAIYSWVTYPRMGIQLIPTATPFVASGVRSLLAPGYDLDLSGIPIIEKPTAFLFLVTAGGDVVLARSRDGLFKVEISTAGIVKVTYSPASVAQGDPTISRQLAQVSTALPTYPCTDEWLIVYVDPSNQTTARNITIWRWNVGTGAWVDITGTALYGHGVLVPVSPDWVVAEGFVGGHVTITDLRVSVGDTTPTTTHTPTSITTSIPNTLRLWINQDQTARFPRVENCRTQLMPECDDFSAPIIGISNRIDGRIVLKVPAARIHQQWDGCPHIKNGFPPAVEDLIVDADGVVSGLTNSYWYDSNAVPTKAVGTIGRGLRKAITVGAYRYSVGAGPVQYIGPTGGRTIARYHPIVVPAVITEAANTIDYQGGLDWDTYYSYAITLYDPVTGNESDPCGYWRFHTDTAPGGPTGTGCAFIVGFLIYSPEDLMGMEIRCYRFDDGTGVYRYEGTAGISGWAAGGSGLYYYSSYYQFSLSDVELALRSEIQSNLSPVPLHTQGFLWGGRAFYIDAFNPSRVRFSEIGQFGNCPPEYVIPTDEGMTGNILGCLNGFDGLILLKERAIWIIPNADTAEQLISQAIVPDVGVASGDSAIFANGVLWWASLAGLYSFDGNSITNHSERLGGIDRKVWDHAPRKTIAYHDRRNWAIRFVCDGSSLSLDTRAGAVSLGSLDDRCCIEIATADYAGSLYGGEGMIWKEIPNSLSLALDRRERISEDTTDVFDSITEWEIGAGAANNGYVKHGWYADNLANALGIDANNKSGSGRAGSLCLRNAAATPTAWTGVTTTGPCAYQYFFDDATFSAKFELETPASGTDEIGICLRTNPTATDWVKLALQKTSGGSESIVLVNTVAGVSTTLGTIAGLTGPWYLRLVRAGSVYTAYRSSDGITWTLIGSFSRVDITGMNILECLITSTVGSAKGYVDLFTHTEYGADDFGPLLPISYAFKHAHWTDGVVNGERTVGITFATPIFSAPGWLEAGCLAGRLITQWDKTGGDTWAKTIQRVDAGSSPTIYFDTAQAALTYFFLDRLPCYYKSQDLMLGLMIGSKVIMRMDALLDAAGDADALATFTFEGDLVSPNPVTATKGGSGSFLPSKEVIVPIRLRCYRARYTLESYTPYTLPSIRSVRMHLRASRPRGRLR